MHGACGTRLKAQDAADCAACVTALLGKVHGLVVAKVARTAPSLAPGLAAGGPGRPRMLGCCSV